MPIIFTRRFLVFTGILFFVLVVVHLFKTKYMTSQDIQDVPEDLENPDLDFRKLLGCHDLSFSSEILQHGEFFFLKNFIRASHGPLRCHETITYTSHGDLTFLDNIVPVLERWLAPLSLALYSPGEDFQNTLTSIFFLRNCLNTSDLVKKFATFHLFFEAKHLPKEFPNISLIEDNFSCPSSPPLWLRNSTYKTANNLNYPINVARNLARSAAMTHFVFASDIELYPSLNLIEDFFKMIKTNSSLIEGKNVFVLAPFEVQENVVPPGNKKELLEMFKEKKAVWFHLEVCKICHEVPGSKSWIEQPLTSSLEITTTAKRAGYYNHWEPFYIGTNSDPWFDERLTWEGKFNKLTQDYVLCLMDYNFHILSTAFVVHRPGIKTVAEAIRPKEQETVDFIVKFIQPEIELFYGRREGCKMN